MRSLTPVKVGAAFSLTAAIGYSLCTLAFWAWPGAAITFMNALFHGLDFRMLQSGPALFDFGAFVWALAVMAAWAFVLGSVFAGILREMDSRARGNDGSGMDSRLRGNDGSDLDSRLRGNDGSGLDSRLRGNDGSGLNDAARAISRRESAA